jgi:hypothetical protein
LCVGCSFVESLDVLKRFAFIDEEGADHDGASVDHRIVGSALLVENWRVKHQATRFIPEPLVKFVLFALLGVDFVQKCVGEYLPD